MSTHTAAPPGPALLELMHGYWMTAAVHHAARLRLADRVAVSPRSIAELATEAGVDASALRRLVRALASIGIFAHDDEGRVALTPMAEALRTDVPGSLHAMALMRGSEWQWRAWRDLGHSLDTGETAFDHVFGDGLFAYLGSHPEDADVFNGAMGSHAAHTHAAVADAYDFSGLRTIVDVGGGHGTLLAAILERYPDARGVLFDLPAVVASAPAIEGVEAVAGDFFETVPRGGDAYVLSHIVHDWDDSKAVALLRRVREAIGDTDARLLACEMVVPEGDEPHLSKLLDLEMLVCTGGVERT